MDKKIIVEHIGGGSQKHTAIRLGYKNYKQVYHWPDDVGDGQLDKIILRMQAKRIKVPAEWLSRSLA